MLAAVLPLYMMSHHCISALTLAASLNGTAATEANLTTNQNKPILAKVLKVTKVTAIDAGHALYIQVLFTHINPQCSHACLNICMLVLHKLQA